MPRGSGSGHGKTWSHTEPSREERSATRRRAGERRREAPQESSSDRKGDQRRRSMSQGAPPLTEPWGPGASRLSEEEIYREWESREAGQRRPGAEARQQRRRGGREVVFERGPGRSTAPPLAEPWGPGAPHVGEAELRQGRPRREE
jgi:hypothetical protein